MSTKYHYRPLVDGFNQNFNLQEEQKMIRRFEKDILAEIKKRKDRKLLVSQYIANFSPKEKRYLYAQERITRPVIIYD
ncbi:hypothetical protein [Enterococcus faecium]|uniref:hypothetical protein n=1 Tax=Enterococcus faecium TaxID=1352 RepID=UPI000CF3439C|nr:hypothetical protein [Enterococcus faecium]PQG96178.1 hypothetical protein CUS55_03190 [Enterococcus faecium]